MPIYGQYMIGAIVYNHLTKDAKAHFHKLREHISENWGSNPNSEYGEATMSNEPPLRRLMFNFGSTRPAGFKTHVGAIDLMRAFEPFMSASIASLYWPSEGKELFHRGLWCKLSKFARKGSLSNYRSLVSQINADPTGPNRIPTLFFPKYAIKTVVTKELINSLLDFGVIKGTLGNMFKLSNSSLDSMLNASDNSTSATVQPTILEGEWMPPEPIGVITS